LAVVFHHAALGTESFVASIPVPIREVMERGYLGVDFFFVLSGFIIYHTNRDGKLTGGAASRFAERRVMRIFVPYLPITMAVIAAYLMLPSLSAAPREWSWLASLFLLPVTDPPALSVAWTLQHELIFYLVFAALFFSGRLMSGCAVWAALILAVNAAGGPARPFQFLFGLINLEFIFGIFAARAAVAATPRSAVLATCSVVALLAFVMLGAPRDLSAVFGLAIALALVPLARLEIARKLRAGRWLLFFGGASYALYLIHNPLISVTSRIAARVPALDNWIGSILLGIVVSSAAAAFYHVAFERPALAFCRRLADRRRAPDQTGSIRQV
jgi:peptidoglycan/LPS O-acetylase OafA/YrhL